jgi:hypothetical protein
VRPRPPNDAQEGILHMNDDPGWKDRGDDHHGDEHHGDKHARKVDRDDRGSDDDYDRDRPCTPEYADDDNDSSDLHAALASMSDLSAILDTAISQLDAGSFDVADGDVADLGSDFLT